MGGRWNPPNSWPTLYLGLTLETVAAEFYRSAESAAVDPQDLLPRNVLRFNVLLGRCLDLRREDARLLLGLDQRAIRSGDRSACQKVGAAAHHAGLEGVIAPSATGNSEVLAIFLDRQLPGSILTYADFTTWTRLPERPQASI